MRDQPMVNDNLLQTKIIPFIHRPRKSKTLRNRLEILWLNVRPRTRKQQMSTSIEFGKRCMAGAIVGIGRGVLKKKSSTSRSSFGNRIFCTVIYINATNPPHGCRKFHKIIESSAGEFDMVMNPRR